MNRSMLALALCLAVAPLAAGCDSEVDSEDGEENGETNDKAGQDDQDDTSSSSSATGTGGDDSDGSSSVGSETGTGGSAPVSECALGDSQDCIGPNGLDGLQYCEESVEQPGLFLFGECQEQGGAGSTPLVLSFDGAEPAMTIGASGAFDLSALGVHGATDWPAAKNPWLAIDRDGDGKIADGGELFGSGSRLSSGRLASQGFEALAELDGNHDGVVDAKDPRFGELLVWSDEDASRSSQGHELSSVSQRGIVSIELASRSEARCDGRGNCGVERARFTFRGEHGELRTGEVVDIHLAYQ